MKKLLGYAVFLVLMAMGVYGVATVSIPISGGTILGNNKIEVNTTLYNVTNCSVQIWSSLTTHLTNITLANISLEANQKNVTNGSVDSVNLPDSNDYNINGTCYNTTDAEQITSRTTISNNQVPTCSFTSGVTYLPDANFTATARNATTARFKFGSNFWLTMTKGSNSSYGLRTWSYSALSAPIPESAYTVSMEALDGTDTGTCTATNILIDSDETKTGYRIQLQQQEQQQQTIIQQQSQQKNIGTLLVVLVIGGIIYWYFKKK